MGTDFYKEVKKLNYLRKPTQNEWANFYDFATSESVILIIIPYWKSF